MTLQEIDKELSIIQEQANAAHERREALLAQQRTEQRKQYESDLLAAQKAVETAQKAFDKALDTEKVRHEAWQKAITAKQQAHIALEHARMHERQAQGALDHA